MLPALLRVSTGDEPLRPRAYPPVVAGGRGRPGLIVGLDLRYWARSAGGAAVLYVGKPGRASAAAPRPESEGGDHREKDAEGGGVAAESNPGVRAPVIRLLSGPGLSLFYCSATFSNLRLSCRRVNLEGTQQVSAPFDYTFETDRPRRPWTVEHADDYQRLYSMPEVIHYIGMAPVANKEAALTTLRMIEARYDGSARRT